MKTDYFAHDLVYRRKREQGETGWDPPAQVEKNLEQLMGFLGGLALPDGAGVLELGCGAGEHVLHLATRGFRAAGVDISPAAIEWARDKAAQLGVEASLHVGDVCGELVLPIGPVRLVLDMHCLHCIIGDDRSRFFATVRRQLAPGGYLYVDTMCGQPHATAMKERFDATTRCVMYGDVAGRYLGDPEAILDEICAPGLPC